MTPPFKRSKYGNKKVVWNGMKFDSMKELHRYHELNLMMKDTVMEQRVVNVERQVPYLFEIGGKRMFKYILDYRVTYADGRVEHEDVKAKNRKGEFVNITAEFKIKKKIIEAVFGIEIKLV
jgi:hypothetical protein